MLVAIRAPTLAARLRAPWRALSFGALAVFVAGALVSHRGPLLEHGGLVMPVVILHNALALALGYLGATVLGRSPEERRALTFEVGIQNSGLGLVILLAHFDGLGGAALVTAGWGVWHLVSGSALALVWARRREEALWTTT
jgi:BASS family bile acid:Na+ symporter